MRYLFRSTTLAVLAAASAIPVQAQYQIPLKRQQEIRMNNACLGNLRELSQGLYMYLQRHNQTLPSLKSWAEVQTVLQPYTRNKTAFACPENKTGYLVNSKLSGLTLAAIQDPGATPLFCDARPQADGTWAVCYADAHAKMLKARPVEFGADPKLRLPAKPKK